MSKKGNKSNVAPKESEIQYKLLDDLDMVVIKPALL